MCKKVDEFLEWQQPQWGDDDEDGCPQPGEPEPRWDSNPRSPLSEVIPNSVAGTAGLPYVSRALLIIIFLFGLIALVTVAIKARAK